MSDRIAAITTMIPMANPALAPPVMPPGAVEAMAEGVEEGEIVGVGVEDVDSVCEASRTSELVSTVELGTIDAGSPDKEVGVGVVFGFSAVVDALCWLVDLGVGVGVGVSRRMGVVGSGVLPEVE
jgi:hypothetical protein